MLFLMVGHERKGDKDMQKYMLFAVAVLIGLACTAVEAAPGDLLQTFLNPTPGSHNDYYFGGSVVPVGDNVLVTSPWDDLAAERGGAAYLFDGDTGTLLQTFLEPAPADLNQFGSSAAVVGEDILIGSYSGERDSSGVAYLFDSSNGQLLQTFPNPSPANGDRFAHSVAALANNVLVGAYGDDTGATDAGAAYLFHSNTGTLLQTFSNPSPAVFEHLGGSVAAVGNNVLLGAPSNPPGATNVGAAYLFNGTTGGLLQSFTNPTPGDISWFGISVAAVGDNVLVGAHWDDTGAENTGAAYLFDSVTGELLQTFLNPTPANDEHFGQSVAAIGNIVLVGAPEDNAGAPGAGAAYLFNATTGELLQTILNPSPEDGDMFGYVVSAFGDNILVGTPHANIGGTNAGVVYLFEAIPEPATLGLLLVGGLAVLRRRRLG